MKFKFFALSNIKAEKDVGSLIDKNVNRNKNWEEEVNIEMLGKIIRVIEFLGKQWLAFRGHWNGAMNEFLNNNISNQRRFLGLTKLISELDQSLKTHDNNVVKES